MPCLGKHAVLAGMNEPTHKKKVFLSINRSRSLKNILGKNKTERSSHQKGVSVSGVYTEFMCVLCVLLSKFPLGEVVDSEFVF